MTATVILGCGAVGTGLATAMLRAGWPIAALWTRSPERARRASALLDQSVASGELPGALSRAELVLLCVHDQAIAPLSQALAARGGVRPGVVVAHTSGCLPATELAPVDGAWRASFHPLTTFTASPAPTLGGAAVALEGNPAALPLLERLARALGGCPVLLAAGAKPAYHAAAVIASSLVLALVDQAAVIASAAGLPDAHRHLGALARAALAGAAGRSLPDAITGPLTRGDVATVAAHLDALPGEPGRLYRSLSRRALALLPDAALDPPTRAQLTRLLEEP